MPSAQSKDFKKAFLSLRVKPLARQWIWKIVKEANKKTSPHTLRHSCATQMAAHGAPLAAIQRLLGHVHISSTKIYTHLKKTKLNAGYRNHHPRGARRSGVANATAAAPAKRTRRGKAINNIPDPEVHE
jgi:integrase/recombinase XerD